MNILLDTHIALWAITDHPKLSASARKLIADPDNTVYGSAVSVWEVMLKHDSPKNNLALTPDDFVSWCEEAGYFPLNLKARHVIAAAHLDTAKAEKLHHDPFDRLLLSQAKAENLAFLTHDEKITLYGEPCVILV